MFNHIQVVPVHSENHYILLDGEPMALISRFYYDGEWGAWSCSEHGVNVQCDHIAAFRIHALAIREQTRITDTARQAELTAKAAYLPEYR